MVMPRISKWLFKSMMRGDSLLPPMSSELLVEVIAGAEAVGREKRRMVFSLGKREVECDSARAAVGGRVQNSTNNIESQG